MAEILFPSAEYDIPRLREDWQVRQVLLPGRAWGSTCRKRWQPGGWHFYVDDSRFSAVWKKPDQPLATGALWLSELNYSLDEQTPEAVAIHRTYQKRWLSRYWQERQVPVLVDLHVPERFRKLNLTGVPDGWCAFSTRGYDSDMGLLEADWQVAREKSGRDKPLMLVVGGGEKVSVWCWQHDCPHLRYEATKNVYSRANIKAGLRIAEVS